MWSNLREKLLAAKQKHERYFPAAFFVAGFLFDIVTLSRIDDPLSIVQQAIYLTAIITVLRYKTLQESGLWSPNGRMIKIWEFHDEALHFVLGSLLSVYSLFYFVSSSLSTSFIFLLIMFSILVVNEFPSFQKRGLMLKYALLFLCLFSFLSILVPVALGFIGLIPFLLSILLGLLIIGTLVFNFTKLENLTLDLRKNIVYPALAISVTLILLYIAKLLPPIPLSIQYIGIYQQIERLKVPTTGGFEKTEYHLKYDRPFWKFWQHGAQSFVAYDNDKIYCFVRVFSPANFQDRVYFHWLKKGLNGWESQDRIENSISGGREEGYRGYAVKSNFDEGSWRVAVESSDGREIGRINFTIEKVLGPAPDDREYKTDIE